MPTGILHAASAVCAASLLAFSGVANANVGPRRVVKKPATKQQAPAPTSTDSSKSQSTATQENSDATPRESSDDNPPPVLSSAPGGQPNDNILISSRVPQANRVPAPRAPDWSDPVEHWQQYVPREAMWLINPWSPVRDSSFYPEDNLSGIVNWWRGPDAVEHMLAKIDEGYQNGARWFMVNRPMGTLGYTHVPGGSWLSINAAKREQLVDRLNAALLDRYPEPVNMVWFIGSELKDPRSLYGWSPTHPEEYYRVGDHETWGQRVGTRSTLGGWISSGASGLAIDASAGTAESDHFITLFNQLLRPPFAVTLIGEMYPLRWRSPGNPYRNADGTPQIDFERLEKMPWLAMHLAFTERWPVQFAPGMKSLNPETTRVYVWMERATLYYGDPDARRALMRDLVLNRGVIPITYDPVMFRAAQEALHEQQGH